VQNYQKVSDYIQKLITACLNSNMLYAVYSWFYLDGAKEAGIRNLLVSSVQIQSIATWVCNEFGEIRTSRQALHARRYVAVKLTSEATSIIREAMKEVEESPAQRQAQLDIWTDLECPIQNSLHYRTVIAPICNWLLQLEADHQSKVAGMRVANEDMPLVHAPLAARPAAMPTAPMKTQSGAEFVDASVLRKGLRSIA